jgi:hypothetical protein
MPEQPLSKREQEARELANNHWAYVRQVLAHDRVPEPDIERIGFHYKRGLELGFRDFDPDSEASFTLNARVDYLRLVLIHDRVPAPEVERICFHFKTAYEHGWKHADESR